MRYNKEWILINFEGLSKMIWEASEISKINTVVVARGAP